MIKAITNRLNAAKAPSPATCFVAIAVAVAAYFPIVATFAYGRSGWNGFVATMVAAAICWISASLALGAVVIFRAQQQPVGGVLFGMLIRMALPIVVGTVLRRQGGALAEGGVFGLILAFYLFTLVIETWLSVLLTRQTDSHSSAA